jgi:hypothetical protein
MNDFQPTLPKVVLKTAVVHTVTYFAVGLLALFALDYRRLFADPNISILMRQTSHPIVAAGPLFQPLRGILFALVFFPLRKVLFGERSGWGVMWLLLVVVGIFSTFGPSPGSIEGMIYTTLPIGFQLIGLPEVILQSLLLSVILCYWVNHPEKKWLNWTLGVLFVLVLLLSGLGLVMAPGKTS